MTISEAYYGNQKSSSSRRRKMAERVKGSAKKGTVKNSPKATPSGKSTVRKFKKKGKPTKM